MTFNPNEAYDDRVIDGKDVTEIIVHRKDGTEIVVLIDSKDYKKVKEYRWFIIKIRRTLYAYTRINGKTIYMHRIILSPSAGKVTDHKNRTGTDNRRSNLRRATIRQNTINATKRHSKTGYIGLFINPCGSYKVSIRTADGKRVYVGTFNNKKDAARAYDKAALKHHKEYAVLNFPISSRRRKRGASLK